MYQTVFLLSIMLLACSSPKKKENSIASGKLSKEDSVVTLQSNDINTAVQTEDKDDALPAVKRIKKPAGIYHAVLPLENQIEQTIVFNSNLTYRLEEKYPDDKDSVVITEGNWMPSDGFIWLYKDQVARGRYKWRGDTLQYFSPLLKKSFPMQPMADASQSEALRYKGKNGVIVYGTSNEPFWSIEYNNKDSISFLLLEWEHPLKLKVQSTFNTKDSVGYIARNDSTEIRLVVFPYFCNDQITNLTYPNKIKVHFNQHTYSGCAIVYQ